MARVRHDDDDEIDARGAVQRASVGLVDRGQRDEDLGANLALRPRSFDEYIGQRALVGKLRIYVQAAKQRAEPLDHVLLHGPPGLGKTTLAQIIAHEMGVVLHTTSGPAIEHKGVLAGLLTGLGDGELLFIDEVHRMSPTVEESLYSAMEDRRIDIPVGEGSAAITHSITLAPFTLVGATTRTALLSAPLRDRFHIVEGLDFYADEDLAAIVERSAALLGLPASPEGALEIGRRSRGTPRIANRLTRRVRDFSQVEGHERISREDAARFLGALEVDEQGLNAVDRRIIETMFDLFEGGPVGVEALAASVGMPRDTIEDVHEPFLLQRGFLVRTPRGRMTTAKAAKHLGIADPHVRGRRRGRKLDDEGGPSLF
ncbi:Holliday junction branch migration DNA helicase RuvB [Pseudenhygromyxa sp. WMMC2535]|uniref:Holliday junction branch migration DNA helicase RuvB n=1 Tax=Pseudenhygromyxa sp. WMMC2535 TaxID=2712867 RepID=UPI00155485DD|nr:Holliday junction branch migration DNA helicase RuvB [Pseudenhygromyxa sp. WMMC2535]NVB41997.1 Holliday junction branch migration DNA helicase RuvB [Pseudenhygromyxa sp. WMMC2535]